MEQQKISFDDYETRENEIIIFHNAVAGCFLSLATQPRNNHQETVLITSLLGLLALDDYWLDLTY